jgi:olefin beta-lactone synthetase
VNVYSLLEERASSHPDRPALVLPERELTFAELETRARALAAALAARGVDSGGRVLVLVPPGEDLYPVVLAVLKLAATAVFVEPAFGVRAAARLAADASAFVGTPRAHLLLRPRTPVRIVCGGWAPRAERLSGLLRERNPEARTATPDESTPALLGFSSGTGGTPKAVARSHALLWAQHRALASAFALEPGDRVLSPLPLFVLHDLAQGAAAVLDERRIDDATVVRGTPRQLEALVRLGRALPRVRAAFVGGAPVTVELLRAAEHVLPRAATWVVYGCTEAEPISAIAAREVLSAVGRGICVGRPVAGARVEIVDGEIVVSGEHVAGGRHRTGDAGYLDPDGRIWLLGRIADRVVRNGRVLHPLEVEPVIDALPAVKRSALIGVGQRAMLVVVPAARAGVARAEVERACREHRIAVDEVRLERRLPLDRRHGAKVLHDELRGRYA